MIKKIRIKGICAAVLSLLLLVLSPASTPAQAQTKSWPKAISIADGRAGSGVYGIAAGMASVIMKYLKIKSNVESSLFGKNLVLLHKGDVEFGMAQANLGYEAARGSGDFKQYGKMKLRLMLSGYTPPAAFVVRADSGIKTVRDLKGRVVMATMPPNMTFTQCGDIILKSAGMTRKDIKDMTFAGPRVGREALAEGRVDAFITLFAAIGKMAWVEELNMQVPIRLVTGEEKALEAAIRGIPHARKAPLYAKYYREMVNNKDLVSIGIPHIFLCRPDLPDEFVYKVTKLFFEKKTELYKFHPAAKPYLANPLRVAVLPYHPGVIKYYKEEGLWTSDLEKLQKKLLKEVGASR